MHRSKVQELSWEQFFVSDFGWQAWKRASASRGQSCTVPPAAGNSTVQCRLLTQFSSALLNWPSVHCLSGCGWGTKGPDPDCPTRDSRLLRA